MTSASIAELKARLSEFLAIVRSGDDVIITDRGRPVARLTALDAGAADGRLEALVRSGTVRPARCRKEPGKAAAERAVVSDGEGRLLASLLEEREQGR